TPTPPRPTPPPYTTLFRSLGDERPEPVRAFLHPELLGDDVSHQDQALGLSLPDRIDHVEHGLPLGGLAHDQHLHRGDLKRLDLRSEEHTSELQSRVDLVCR